MVEDRILDNFYDPIFTDAFRRYFEELGISVTNWDSLWDEMNRSNVSAFLRVCDRRAIGFVQYQPILSKSCFFEERLGFIREFWVDPNQRGQGHGGALLVQVEEIFRRLGIARVILTTDSAENFYLKHGYRKRTDILARNRSCVYVKEI